MTESTIDWSIADGIVTLTFDDPAQSVNTMRTAYLESMERALERLRTVDGVVGVILASGKKTFFAGGDLNELLAVRPADAEDFTAFTTRAKAQLRTLETLGVPVVAALNGHALGGGLELALAAHHRICIDDPRLRVGFPEVTLGLLPGAGGVVRTVRLLGLDTALDRVLLSGARFAPDTALELGLIDAIVPAADLHERARQWIRQNADAAQPWDAGVGIPGGTATEPVVQASLAVRTAALRAEHQGAPMPAEAAILSAAVESTQVDIDTAFAVETRYFVQLVVSQIAKNIIQGTFFDRQTVTSGASRPTGYPVSRVERIAVVGAGLMGSGIAMSAAQAGIDVVIADVDATAAARAKSYAEKALAKQVSRGRCTPQVAAQIVDRIRPVAGVSEFEKVDVVIEAVFEDPDLKARVFRDLALGMDADTLIASNTSTLPITGLATSVDRPDDFVGLHFFSPVERMDLIEIVVGELTSEAAVARAFDFARQLGKIPIVVGDGRGFFTSRVILTRILEAAAMLGEGFPPASIEQASRQAGYPVGVLALTDETSLALPCTIYGQFRAEAERLGLPFSEHPGADVLTRMVHELNRPGRAAGAGYYEYVDGHRIRLWAGLEGEFGPSAPAGDLDELKDRMLFSEALETARCLESGLLRTTADANVGSMLGIGFPRWTGGTAQFVAGYPGGEAAFVARAYELAERHGPRFLPPDALVTRAMDAGSAMDAAHA